MRQRLFVSVVFGLLTGGVPCPKRSECVHAQQVHVRNIENRGEKMSELIKRFITATVLQSPNQKIPDRKTKCVIKTHINIKQNVIFSAKLKPV